MIETLENFSKLFCSVVGKFVFRERQDIDKMAFENSALSDEQLKLQCHLVASGAEIQGKGLKRSFIEWLITIFSSFFGISNPVMLQRLALGVEAFKRVPADLPKGSQLYPQQIEAAMALTQRCIIQMDTGEGKTYALLPAAFALACEHYRVFIVCANEYLAWRDATRTRDYWNYVGLSVGLFTQHSQERELSCRIVYTTLRDLIFHYLRNGISTTKSSYSLHGALLIDEADDVLLDKATQSYHLNQDIRSDAFDWTFAIEYAESLAEGEDVVVDRGELDANLTILGEEKLREALEARALTASSYFLTRFAVEIAYVAVKLVREGTHYIVENDQAYPVDLITGKIDRSITPTWIIPLEYLSGLQARPESVTLDKISGINFLKKFPHLAGLSGTIENDYFEYVYTYFLLPIKIEPRFERHKENIPDYIFAKRNDSLRQLAEEVKAIVSRGRPLLIGTQTITDAEDIYRLLKEALPPATNVNLLTGKNDRDAAEYFERAGQVGQVLIATQLAGRGVDIRLSDEARQNGGLALIGYGHALEPRFDRQFLGRAGRQGDPFTAQFFCSLEDPLFEVFTGENLRQLMGWTGLSGDSAIESPLVSRRLRGAQLNLRRHQFLRRRSMIGLEMLDSEVRLTLESWFSYLQIPYEFLEDRENSSTGQGDEDGRCSQAFVEKVVEEYLTTELEPLLGGKKNLTYKEAEQITIFFKNSVGLENILNPLELEGSNQQIATDKIRKKLKDKIIEAEQKYLSEKVQVSELFFKVAADYSNYQEAKYHAEEERRLASLAEEESQFAREFEAFVDENRADGDDTALADEGIEGWEVDTFDIFTQPDAAGDEHSLVATNCTAEDEVAVVISPMVSPQIEEELSLAYSEAYEKYELFRKRSPKEIAYWSILTNWMDYLEERERVIHRGYLKGYSFAKFYRVVTDGVLSEWHKKEALIAPDLLRNLLQCDQPATLNELFFLADNSTINSSKKDNDVAFDWSPGIDNESYLDGTKVSADLLIQQFNAHYHEQIEASDLSLNQMRLLLQNFLSQFPLHTLQNPDRIQKAIENWPTLWEVDRSHKKIRLAWLRTFLLYLRSRDLIGPLPDYRNRVRSFFSRLQERLAEMKTIFSLSGIMAFTTVFIVSSYLGHFAQPKQLGVFGQQVDYLLFGGFLSEGIFTAPSLAVLILATTLTHILFPGASDQSPGTGFDRVLAPLLQVAFAIWLTDWSYGNSLTIRALHATAVFLAIFLFSYFAQLVVWLLQHESGIQLTSGWLCYTAAFVYAPYLVGSPIQPSVPLVCLLAGILTASILQAINYCEVPLISSRIKNSSITMIAEEIDGCWSVLGGCGSAPHIYSLVFCWVIYETSEVASRKFAWDMKPSVLEVSLIALYFAIIWWMIGSTLKRRFSPVLWEERLNSNHQGVQGVNDKQSLEKILRRFKWQLLWKELLVQFIVIVVIGYLLSGFTLPETMFPLALVIVCLAMLIADQGREFIQQIYTFLLRKVQANPEPLDLSRVPEPQEKETPYYRLKYILKHRIGLIFAIITVVIQLVNMLIKAKNLLHIQSK